MRRPLVDPQKYAPRGNRSYVLVPDGRGGVRIEVDPGKKFVVPFTLVSEPRVIEVPAAIPFTPGDMSLVRGGVVAQPAIFPIDNKGPFEICYSSFRAVNIINNQEVPTDQFMAIIFDPKYRPLLMNREIHARTMAGGFGDALATGMVPAIQSAGGRPFVWPETFFMEPDEKGSALFMGFRNLTQFPLRIQWAFHGLRYYHLNPFKEAMKEKQQLVGSGRISWPYFYTTDTDVVLAADEARDYDIRLTDEADVEIFKMTHYSDFPYLWRIMEKAGERFLDTAGQGAAGVPNGIHSDFGFGSGEFPFIPFETMYYEKDFKIVLSLVNRLTQNQNRIWNTFTCRKITHVGEQYVR